MEFEMKTKEILTAMVLLAALILSGCRVGPPVKIVIPELGLAIEEPNIGFRIGDFGSLEGSGNVYATLCQGRNE